MQIQPNTPPAIGPTGNIAQTNVEQSEQANQDRDAQGQGDGLADRGAKQQAKAKSSEDEPTAQETGHKPAPRLPGEPPARLDIIC